METFIQQYQKGLVTAERIDDFIDQWHTSDTEQTLPAFLGMSSEHYFRWLKNPAALPEIVSSCVVSQDRSIADDIRTVG